MGKKKAPSIPAVHTPPTPDDSAAKEAAAKEKRAMDARKGAYGSTTIATSPLGDTTPAPTNQAKLSGRLGV